MLVKLVTVALVLFVGFALILSQLQNRIIFPVHAVGGSGPMPSGTKRLTLDTPDGYRLHGVHVPPAVREGGSPTLVLGFAGNAWNSAHAASYLHQVFPEAHVVAFHYRGYAPSTGSPSAHALLSDAPLVFDAAVDTVKPKRTIVAGFSIGSAVAASLAARRPLDGLILVTPFDSLKAVASAHYPWLPVGTLFREELHAAESLEASNVPTAIIAAERDTLIPPRRTDALRQRVRNLVYDRTIERAGHNDLYQRAEFQSAMREALDRFVRQ